MMFVKMDGWVGEQMDGLMGGWFRMDEYMEGCLPECKDG